MVRGSGTELLPTYFTTLGDYAVIKGHLQAQLLVLAYPIY
jgi:hypothetical protein